MDRLGPQVRRELGRYGPAAGMADVVAAWPAAVGEAIARNAWPTRTARDGTLHVATSSSTWAFELGQLERSVLERLGAALGDAAPRRLRFAVGRLPPPGAESPDEAAPSPLRVSREQREAAAALTAGIADEELRELVAGAAAASLARAASDRAL